MEGAEAGSGAIKKETMRIEKIKVRRLVVV